MIQKIDLSGIWKFQLDKDKKGLELGFNKGGFEDTIALPGSTSEAKKGDRSQDYATGYLTEEYAYAGYAWFEKDFFLTSDLCNQPLKLYLERTRITKVWIDGNYIGSQDSLCTPHIYDLTANLLTGQHTLVVMVDNTDYPTKGGHMTSPDTQTNWNGITGIIELRAYSQIYIEDLQLYPSIDKQGVSIEANLHNHTSEGRDITIEISAKLLNQVIVPNSVEPRIYNITISAGITTIELFYPIAQLECWDEYHPNIYQLELITNSCGQEDVLYDTFGFRQFIAGKEKFHINGHQIFLRGKHDGLIFPITGYAPTTLEDWLKVMTIAKKYGINHYRFHTCCPPEAAFMAADQLGIYMEPELPFWGTITDETYPEHNKKEQDYLILEGIKILRQFGNHPSFVMMSLGNELWGSKKRLSEILKVYKEQDPRHLYTQGSNNFQFVPDILEEDDFFVGVRFDRDRLFRGSYAMCDAPLGHVQTMAPNTLTDYDTQIQPVIHNDVQAQQEELIDIQFHDHTVQVLSSSQAEVLIPNVPVISHEIGQYETFPNFKEIEKYTGVLKARNLEIFKERLEDKGLGDLSQQYFEATGKLAVSCYKEELEAAFRTNHLAGFQLLDLQDFSGQGTALVGVLDAFMEEKGTVSQEEWRSFCSDAVLLGRFAKYNYISGETLTVDVQLSYYRFAAVTSSNLIWTLEQVNATKKQVIQTGNIILPHPIINGLTDIGTIVVELPQVLEPTQIRLRLNIEGTVIQKEYIYLLYPIIESDMLQYHGDYSIYHSLTTNNKVYVVHAFNQVAKDLLTRGENVLLLPTMIKNGLQGFYSTDFWCYPMFRSISESMNKDVPVGTMGLLIDNSHKALALFPSEFYSTPQWYQIVTNSTSVILDDTSMEFRPIVQVIDNFERNHKLGLLFESKVAFNTDIAVGNLLVCTSHLEDLLTYPEAKQFLYSILEYASSSSFQPTNTLTSDILYNM